MKFFAAIALLATVASAAMIRPTVVSGEAAEIQEIIAAIQSPSTNPATAAALEQMLLEAMGVKPEEISVGPAIIDFEPIAVGPAIVESETEYEPISVGPAIIDFEPVSVGPAIIDFPVPVDTSPVVIGAIPEGASPLVQIIVNVNKAGSPVAPAPVTVPEIAPTPVHVVDSAPEPVQVVEVAPVPVDPVQVVAVAPEPVQVIEAAPVPIEPILIGTPIIPAPAVVLPEELN